MENVNDIIADIVTGISKTDGKYVIIPDGNKRSYSIEHAQEEDVAATGKG